MNTLENIQYQLNLLYGTVSEYSYVEPKYIILHPATERKVFTNNELSKSESLEDHFNLPVILSKQITEDEIIIGV